MNDCGASLSVCEPGEADELVPIAEAAGSALRTLGADGEVKRALTGFKRPRRHEILAELPPNTMVKVQKNQLRDHYKDTFGAA